MAYKLGKYKLVESEHSIQNTIISYLWMRGYYVQRLNSGKIPMQSLHGQRLIQLMPPGTPDIMAFKKNELLFIEVKRPGKKPTYLQEEKMKELETYGARCFVATSLEDVEDYLK